MAPFSTSHRRCAAWFQLHAVQVTAISGQFGEMSVSCEPLEHEISVLHKSSRLTNTGTLLLVNLVFRVFRVLLSHASCTVSVMSLRIERIALWCSMTLTSMASSFTCVAQKVGPLGKSSHTDLQPMMVTFDGCVSSNVRSTGDGSQRREGRLLVVPEDL